MNAELLIIGGGGAGGGDNVGGGGGAGGVIHVTVDLSSLADGTVTVGVGGVFAANNGNGTHSSFSGHIAAGGGGGAIGGYSNETPGGNGGSGGGGGGTWVASYVSAGGAGTTGQGYAGGVGINTPTTDARSGGGGGGAGAAGQSASDYNGGDGGSGIQLDITGASAWYAGGGGGATNSTSGHGIGGSGVGGSGGDDNNTQLATSGAANTGSGGGGSGYGGSGTPGSGGSGVVILRYAGEQVCEGGSVSSVAGYTIHVWLTSGTFVGIGFIQVIAALDGYYGDSQVLSAAVVGQYGDAAFLRNALTGVYSILMESALTVRYGDTAAITASLIGRYGNAATIQAALIGRYGDMVPVLAALEGRYHLMHSVLAGLEGEYAICGSSVLAALDGRYDLRERNEIMAALVGYYSLLPGATIQQIGCPVRIGGVSVRWSSVSWTISEDAYLIEATVVLRDPAEFGSIAKLDTVEIDWAGTTYTLFVAAKLRSRSISGDAGAAEYGADYTIIARSLTAGLDAPYALPVTMSWPATTLASAIAADLIASLPELITLDFRLEDWPQPGGTFFLTDETPLEGLRKLAAIIDGIVQTSPDNALILRMTDPTPPAEWEKVVPAWTIDDSGLFSDSESESESNRYNVITVSNQGESDRSTRFEVEDITDLKKRVRGYRVPWTDFGLTTSGGSWVTIEDGGVIEEPVVDEVVEFVEGSSNAPLPVYSMVSVVWLQASLGAITAAEDGSLTSEVVGNSLAKISYTTRCHMWIGTSDRSEEVQFYEVEL